MAISYILNPFTGAFDAVDGAGVYWLSPVASFSDLTTTDPDGSTRIVKDEDAAYTYNSGTLTWIFAGKVKSGVAGSSPNTAGYSVSADNTLTLQPANATNPGIISTAAQAIAGDKTFSGIVVADGGVDVTATAGTDTLNIGGTSANVVNIGRSGATINIQGTTLYENVTQLQVTDPLITINSGGGAGSAANSGIELEEDTIITGYATSSGDRNSWSLKAPNTAGIATITPGAGGITLDQSSHNPLTLGAVGASPNANAASLSTQVLTLQPADATNPGVITTGSQTIAGTKTLNSSPILNSLTASTALALDGSKNIVSSATTITELGYVNGVTSSIQTQLDSKPNKSVGDINETSFAASQTQTNADVTGLAFANGSVRSFEAIVSVYVDATSDLFEQFRLNGIQRGADWQMSATSVGDISLFSFTITNAGQVQYSSGTYVGFSSAAVRFRAISTSV